MGTEWEHLGHRAVGRCPLRQVTVRSYSDQPTRRAQVLQKGATHMATTTTPKRTTTTRTRKPKAKALGKGGTVTQHGVTTTGYQRGCRCDLCVQAYRDYAKVLRERKAKATKPVKTAKRRAAR
jgi:hypothetical protein